MIFQRSILREKMTVSFVILFTLLTITLVLFLVRGLREAAGGSIAVEGVMQLMLITTLRYLPLLVVVTTVVSIVLTVSRLYQQSEMVVWQASGLSALSLLRPVLLLVLPMCVFLLFINNVLAPWGNKQLIEYRNESGIKGLNLLKSGTFQVAQNGDRVFFVNEVIKSAPPVFKDIFVLQKKSDETIVVTARQATLKDAYDNRSFLILNSGHQYQDKRDQEYFQSMLYDNYGFSIDEFTKVKSEDLKNPSVEVLQTQELIQGGFTPERQAELYRRISDSIMILPMALLALVFGYVRPRGVSRAWGVLSALLLFMVFLNFIKLGEARIASSRWSFTNGLLIVHGTVWLLTLAALWYRQYAWRFSMPVFFQRR